MDKTFCIFSAQYYPHMGGVENYTAHVAEELVKQGNRVIIVTNNNFHLAKCETLRDKLTILRLPCHNLLNGRYPIPKKNTVYKELLSWLNNQPIDYAIINTRFYPLSILGATFANDRNIRPILIDHGSAHLAYGNPIADKAVAFVEHKMTNKGKHYNIDYYGVSSKSVEWLKHFDITAKGVLSNAIDADSFRESASSRNWNLEFRLSEDDFVVVFAGRLIPEKGIHQLLQAANQLQEMPRIKIIIAGEGPLRQTIDNRKLPNIFCAGKLDPADLASLLCRSDAFCLPTRSEGFSTSLLEAAACSSTPIITRVGGVEELMPDDKFGIVLENTDPQAIANAIAELANDRNLCRKMASNINIRVDELFSWKQTTDSLIEACEKANE